MKTLICASTLTLFASTALAGEPLELTTEQMDKVTAAGGVEVLILRDGEVVSPVDNNNSGRATNFVVVDPEGDNFTESGNNAITPSGRHGSNARPGNAWHTATVGPHPQL
jgi:hypothetical protein